MKSFRNFLAEHLSPSQERNYSKYQINPGAQERTDHYFGPGILEKEFSINDNPKSETHNQVEAHLGRELTRDEYVSGHTTDKYGRTVRIGKMIKDKSLLDSFSRDPSRSSSVDNSHTMRVVRGYHVFGQTNPAVTDQQPKGHSWQGISCKNVETGMARSRLPDEVAAGTVVAFAKNHRGEEIYRATLQPYHGESGDPKDVIYRINSEYGLKLPIFQKHAQSVAEDLSTKDMKSPSYTIDSNVYDNDGERYFENPHMSADEKFFKTTNESLRSKLIRKNLLSDKVANEIFDQKWREMGRWEAQGLVEKIIKHPGITHDRIAKALIAGPQSVKVSALADARLTKEHLPLINIADHWSKIVDNDNASDEVKQVAYDHLLKHVPDHNFVMNANHYGLMKTHGDRVIDRLLGIKDFQLMDGVRYALGRIVRSGATHEQIRRIHDYGSQHPEHMLSYKIYAQTPNLPSEIRDKVVKHVVHSGDPGVQQDFIETHVKSADELHRLLDSASTERSKHTVHGAALFTPHANNETAQRALNVLLAPHAIDDTHESRQMKVGLAKSLLSNNRIKLTPHQNEALYTHLVKTDEYHLAGSHIDEANLSGKFLDNLYDRFPSHETGELIASHPNVESHTIDKVIRRATNPKDSSKFLIAHLGRSGKLTTEQMVRMIDHPNRSIAGNFVKELHSRKDPLPNEVVDSINKHDDLLGTTAFVGTKHANEESYERALSSDRGFDNVVYNPDALKRLTHDYPQTLRKHMLHSEDDMKRAVLAANFSDHLTKNDISILLSKATPEFADLIKAHAYKGLYPNVTKRHVTDAVASGNSSAVGAALSMVGAQPSDLKYKLATDRKLIDSLKSHPDLKMAQHGLRIETWGRT